MSVPEKPIRGQNTPYHGTKVSSGAEPANAGSGYDEGVSYGAFMKPKTSKGPTVKPWDGHYLPDSGREQGV